MLKNYSDIYRFFIQRRLPQMWLFLGLAFSLALLAAPIPYLFGYLLDDVIFYKDKQLLIKVVSILAFLKFSYVLLSYFNSVLTHRVRKEISVDIVDSMLVGIFNMPYEKRSSINSGELISRLTRDVNELYFILPFGIAKFVYHICFSSIMVGVLVFLNWKLSLMLFLLFPFVVVVYKIFNKELWRLAFKDAEASASNMKFLNEIITADYEIKAYGATDIFKSLAMKAVKHYQSMHFQRMIVNEKVSASVNLFPVIATIIIWYFASVLAIGGEISVGLIVTYTTSIGLIIPSLMIIIKYISEYPNQIAVLNRIKEFSQRQEEEKREKQKEPNDLKVNVLQIKSIDFAYQDAKKAIFNDFSYHFDVGKTYLIKAPNGFGKSTLFSLLSKQLEPTSGEIYLDDKVLSSIGDIHDYITLLPQQINIISDTIERNLTFGDSSITKIEILKMLDHLGLGQWLDEKEKGLESVLSSKQLSGGQIQRIGLARAFLRRSSVLLLDEPTNNLDNAAVNLLIHTIQSLSEDKIVLIISHDDRIYPHVDEVLNLSF